MYSAYKLNKQSDNIQPWCTPFPIWDQSVVPCPVLLFPDLHTDFSTGRSGGLVCQSLSEFSTVCCDPHSQSLWHSQEKRSRCLSGILLLSQWSNRCWQSDLCSSRYRLNIWKFTVHVLLKPGLENLSITLLVCEMSAIVCGSLNILWHCPFWDWDENWPFPVLRPLYLTHICPQMSVSQSPSLSTLPLCLK